MLRDRKVWFSGYWLLWMLVMFDLPVVEDSDRKAATRFRSSLMDLGFSMAQYSIYFRLLGGYDQARVMERKIESLLPPHGRVNILTITDKQYERMKVFTGTRKDEPEKPTQLTLF